MTSHRSFLRLCPACGSYKVFEPDEAPHGDRECAECGWYGVEAQTIRRSFNSDEQDRAEGGRHAS